MLAGVDHLILFIAAGLLLNPTPGPDVLTLVGNGLQRGWQGRWVAALGITGACFVPMAAATKGRSALMAASAMVCAVLKRIVAAYRMYVGATARLARPRGAAIPTSPASASTAAQATADASVGAGHLPMVFVQGVRSNALNWKVALVSWAFLPLLMDPEAQHKCWTWLLPGPIFTINALPVNRAHAWGAAWLSSRLLAMERGMAWLKCGAGALFVNLDIRLRV